MKIVVYHWIRFCLFFSSTLLLLRSSRVCVSVSVYVLHILYIRFSSIPPATPIIRLFFSLQCRLCENNNKFKDDAYLVGYDRVILPPPLTSH